MRIIEKEFDNMASYEVSREVLQLISQRSGLPELTIAMRLGEGKEIVHQNVVWTMEEA